MGSDQKDFAHDVDYETIREWTEPFADWYYYPEFVIPPTPPGLPVDGV